MKRIQKYFISGILIVAPLALSLYVAWIVVGIADNIFKPFIPLHKFGIFNDIHGVGLIVAFVFFTIIGAVAGSFFGRLYQSIVDSVLSKIPGLNSIYNTVKQIIETFAGSANWDAAIEWLEKETNAYEQAILDILPPEMQ